MVSPSVSCPPSKPPPTISTLRPDSSSGGGKLPTSSSQTESYELSPDSKLTVSKIETESTASLRPKPLATAARLHSGGRSSNVVSSADHHSSSSTRESSPSRASSPTTDYHTGMRVESARTGPTAMPDGLPHLPGDLTRKNPSPGFGARLISGVQENQVQALPVDAGASTRRAKQGKRQPARVDVKPASKITPESSPSLSTNTRPSSSTPSSSLAVSEPKPDLFVRKESDESIHSSESDQSGSSTTSSDNSPDTEESPTSTFAPPHLSHQVQQPGQSVTEKLVLRVKPVQHQPSYTKEPGTGQTVPVKENGSDDGSSPVAACIEDETGSNDSGAWPRPLAARKEVSPSLPLSSISKPRSKKKLRAQLKREEKQKRRQRERELLPSSKAMNDSQESIDKESVASNSTNSTDNFEDEAPIVPPAETPGEQHLKGKEKPPETPREQQVNDQEERSPPPKLAPNTQTVAKAQGSSLADLTDGTDDGSESKAECPVTTSSRVVGQPEVADSEDRNGLPTKSSADGGKENDGSFISREALLDSQVTAVKEPSKTVTTAPSGASSGSKPHKKLQEIYSDVFSRSPDKSTYTAKNGGGKKQITPGDKVKPSSDVDGFEAVTLVRKGVAEDENGDVEEEEEDIFCADLHSADVSSTLDSTANQDTPPRTRPQKLDIAIPDDEDGPVCEPPGMDVPSPLADLVESDDGSHSQKTTQASKMGPTSPHEIAASLLSSNQSILRRSKLKNDKEKSVSPEDAETATSVAVTATSTSNKPTTDKFPKSEVDHHRVGPPTDHPGERRSNFSVNAPPYVPPHPHYQYNYHPPAHHHRRPLLQPPHRMPSPTFEYPHPPVRPCSVFLPDEPGHGYLEQGYDRRTMRKVSDYTKYHQKSFTPSPSYHYQSLGEGHFPPEHHRPPLLGAGSAGMYDSHPDWGSAGVPDPTYIDVTEDPRAVLPHGGGVSGGRYREMLPTMATRNHVRRERSGMHPRRPAYDVSPNVPSAHSHLSSSTYHPDDDGLLWEQQSGHGFSEDLAYTMTVRSEREQLLKKMRRQRERERQQLERERQQQSDMDMHGPIYRQRFQEPLGSMPSADLSFSDISYPTEDENIFSDAATHMQPLQHKKQQRHQLFTTPVIDRDEETDLSTLLPPLNRAPGSTRERSSTTGSTLLSDIIDHSARSQASSKWPLSPVEVVHHL